MTLRQAFAGLKRKSSFDSEPESWFYGRYRREQTEKAHRAIPRCLLRETHSLCFAQPLHTGSSKRLTKSSQRQVSAYGSGVNRKMLRFNYCQAGTSSSYGFCEMSDRIGLSHGKFGAFRKVLEGRGAPISSCWRWAKSSIRDVRLDRIETRFPRDGHEFLSVVRIRVRLESR